ncbi:MAG: hypothetical protein KC680_03920 [Candidatus Peregrinibacteria bacterium]|nr:hypothetical protein [Candidatus Peregrinibacteria bacterium]MCB9807841.1 hypothetical protein [Candidatus Peribacteria bacterium]
MIRVNTPITRRALQWATISLGSASLVMIAYGFTHDTTDMLEARMLPDSIRGQIEWVTISADRVMSGATVPANKHVIIHIPDEITRITRRTLFGQKGDTVRYWGYCLPHNLDEGYAKSKQGFPGDLFLSEAEREYRRQKLIEERRRTFSIFQNLTFNDLNEVQSDPISRIRHQIDIFKGGDVCYVMTEKSIPVGADIDDDGLNSALERGFGSDVKNPDTDGDGILDGLEVLRLHSHPTKRDSDGDGLIDGIEDKNRNGIVEPTETNPIEWDTDRDGLCDGICKVNKGQDLRGEDKNLNGIYEPELNEYNPISKDSDGDGILDDHEVYLCVIGGGDDC